VVAVALTSLAGAHKTAVVRRPPIGRRIRAREAIAATPAAILTFFIVVLDAVVASCGLANRRMGTKTVPRSTIVMTFKSGASPTVARVGIARTLTDAAATRRRKTIRLYGRTASHRCRRHLQQHVRTPLEL